MTDVWKYKQSATFNYVIRHLHLNPTVDTYFLSLQLQQAKRQVSVHWLGKWRQSMWPPPHQKWHLDPGRGTHTGCGERRILRQKNVSLLRPAGNRNWIHYLESRYAHHYTTVTSWYLTTRFKKKNRKSFALRNHLAITLQLLRRNVAGINALNVTFVIRKNAFHIIHMSPWKIIKF